MRRNVRHCGLALVFFVLAGIFLTGTVWAAGDEAARANPPEYGLSTDMGDAMVRQAGQVKQQIQQQAGTLFQRQPLGFSWDSVIALYNWIIMLPLKIPALLQLVADQGQLLGVAGSV